MRNFFLNFYFFNKERLLKLMTFGNFTDYDNDFEKSGRVTNSASVSVNSKASVSSKSSESVYGDNFISEGYNDISRSTTSAAGYGKENYQSQQKRADYSNNELFDEANPYMPSKMHSEEQPSFKNMSSEDKDKFLATIMWIVPLVSIVMLMTNDAKKNTFVFHHAKQALTLGVSGTLIGVALSVFFLVAGVVPVVKEVIGFLSCGVWGSFSIIYFLYAGLMAFKAHAGEMPRVFGVGDIVDQYIK